MIPEPGEGATSCSSNNDNLPRAVATPGPYVPEIIVAGENVEILAGDSDDTRTVLLKFKDRDTAKRWYDSPGYQAIVNLRLDSVEGARGVLCDSFEG